MKHAAFLISLLAAFLYSCSVSRVPVEFEKLLEKGDTHYVINKVYDLDGKDVLIPKNVTIEFGRGKIINGTLVGQNTTITNVKSNQLAVEIKGTWVSSKIEDTYFNRDILSDDQILSSINNLMSDAISNNVIIKRNYTGSITAERRYLLAPKSNSVITLKGTLSLAPNNLKAYEIIDIRNKSNISIKGGIIKGDVGKHRYVLGSSSEWGMGLSISKGEHVLIQDMFITLCTGDGVYIGGGNETYLGESNNASKDITLRNVKCDSNRRQGLSVIHVDGLLVEKCKFINTGVIETTPPSAGIDLEPNVSNGRNNCIKNATIKNCEIRNNKGRSFEADLSVKDGNISNYENVLIDNVIADGQFRICADNCIYQRCKMESIQFRLYESPVSVILNDCEISGENGITFMPNHKHDYFYKSSEPIRTFKSVVFNNCKINVSPSSTTNTRPVIVYSEDGDVPDKIEFNNCAINTGGLIESKARAIFSELKYTKF